MLSVSVITPTLNEDARIADHVERLTTLDRGPGIDLDIIVADGGSTDRTVERVPPAARIVAGPRGRGAQMNAGAAEAAGDILWFVHADCRPHAASLPALGAALEDPAVAGGAFEYGLDEPGAYYRLVESLSNRKNRLLGQVFGDMGIFVRREVFRRMGGYREIPLMEDMDFGRRLRREGRIVILPQRIETSARRWREEGVAWNVLRNWALQAAWLMGADPARLARWYAFGNAGAHSGKRRDDGNKNREST